MEITAAVSETVARGFTLKQLQLGEPRADEVLVKLVATGLCHTDIAAHKGVIPMPAPVVLGHEGAGVVVRVGAAVNKVVPGDHVVLSLASCGTCDKCSIGMPTYCRQHAPLNWQAQRADGSVSLHDERGDVHSHFFGQSSFAQYAVVNASSVVTIDKAIPLEYLGPLACGLMTGAGAVMNTLRAHVGSGLVVFGLGAVGLAAVMAARVVGCGQIVAVDIKENRLALAKELGATVVINPKTADVAEVLHQLTNGYGVDYSVEAAGHASVMADAVKVLSENGKCVLTGVVPQGESLPLDIMHLIRGRAVQGSIMGDAAPTVFIPMLAQLFQQGRFPIDRLIRFYDMNDINQAMADSQSGETIKAVIRM
ncbi:Aryl-alcohol dehydrogenase [Serratia grimesii]|uniref:NAD(P)-dependent alcohol dehydrogenase n=1 Tax=Serratia grimesii TaxID=82995 RepID=UPI00217CBDD8|nr:NAD(P)-dependent alcohol dehydrogenase [Serratia grimesii]CAI1546911.1 Aryl-alcohol dehydrogenase [Serratia grimesii]